MDLVIQVTRGYIKKSLVRQNNQSSLESGLELVSGFCTHYTLFIFTFVNSRKAIA